MFDAMLNVIFDKWLGKHRRYICTFRVKLLINLYVIIELIRKPDLL